MGDFLSRIFQKKAANENKAILREMLWGNSRPRRKGINNEEEKVKVEKPVQIKQDTSTQPKGLRSETTKQENINSTQTKAQQSDTTKKANVKLIQTQSGNHILSRGWDGNNMAEYRVRKKR